MMEDEQTMTEETETAATSDAPAPQTCGECDAYWPNPKLLNRAGLCTAKPPVPLVLVKETMPGQAQQIVDSFYPGVTATTPRCRNEFRPRAVPIEVKDAPKSSSIIIPEGNA